MVAFHDQQNWAVEDQKGSLELGSFLVQNRAFDCLNEDCWQILAVGEVEETFLSCVSVITYDADCGQKDQIQGVQCGGDGKEDGAYLQEIDERVENHYG